MTTYEMSLVRDAYLRKSDSEREYLLKTAIESSIRNKYFRMLRKFEQHNLTDGIQALYQLIDIEVKEYLGEAKHE